MSLGTDCGHANGEAERFCEACGAPLAAPAEEHPKVVTVPFCEVGSTAWGESVDPEALGTGIRHRRLHAT